MNQPLSAAGTGRKVKTMTISGRMSLSPEQNPLRSRAATVL